MRNQLPALLYFLQATRLQVMAERHAIAQLVAEVRLPAWQATWKAVNKVPGDTRGVSLLVTRLANLRALRQNHTND